MRNRFVQTILDIAADNSNLYLITGDLGFGVLTKFQESFPNQFINAGVCEQNMTSVAAGMALEGKTVITYSIANFSTARCLEQIRNDVAYHQANVKIVAVGGGFSYGALGMSHHATEDLAIMRSMPEMTVFTPCDPRETEMVTRTAIQMNGPCYIRLGKGGEKTLNDEGTIVSFDKANILRNGENTAILVAGAIANEALIAADLLKRDGIDCAVYSFPSIKPLDKETILRLAGIHENLFTLEEHNIIGGFGSAVSEVIAENRTKTVLTRIGLNDEFTSVVGSQEYLRKFYGLNAKNISRIIQHKFKLIR